MARTTRLGTSRSVIAWVVACAATTTVLVAVVWGQRLQRVNRDLKLGAAPLVGDWTWRVSVRIVPAIVVAIFVLVVSRRRLPYRVAVVANSLLGVCFCFALAASDGLDRLLDPVVHRTEYWANLARLPGTAEMLREYSQRSFLLRYSVHLKGHPPGFPLLLKGLGAVGLGRPWTTGALSFLGVALTIAGLAGVLKRVVSERAAIAVLPFLAVAPFMVWMGVSADAFFCGVAAVACYLLVCALTQAKSSSASASGPNAALVGLGLLSGLLFGYLLMLTYGATTFGVIPLTLLLTVRGPSIKERRVVTCCTALGVITVFGLFAANGFWWLDGLNTTRKFYWTGTAQFRPWRYFLVGNIGALLIAIGPVVVLGIARLRARSAWRLVGAAVVAVSLANASQYSKGEVERIWLMFMPWLTIGVLGLCAPRSVRSTPRDRQLVGDRNNAWESDSLGNSTSDSKGTVASSVPTAWLATTAIVAITLQVALQSKW
jgi:methylthioxylose transferase